MKETHGDWAKAYWEGWEAPRDGNASNPYEVDTDMHREWGKGHNARILMGMQRSSEYGEVEF